MGHAQDPVELWAFMEELEVAPLKSVHYTTIKTGGCWIKFLCVIIVSSTSAACSAHHNLRFNIVTILWNAWVLCCKISSVPHILSPGQYIQVLFLFWMWFKSELWNVYNVFCGPFIILYDYVNFCVADLISWEFKDHVTLIICESFNDDHLPFLN